MEEVEKFREAFDVYDNNGNGEIEKNELIPLLGDLDFRMNTKSDQKEMLRQMDAARAKARASGLGEKFVGSDGEPSLTFHSFVFLLRMVQKGADNADVDHDAMMLKTTNFTQAEINDFREIFGYWAEKVRALEQEARLRRSSLDADVTDQPRELRRRLTMAVGIDHHDHSSVRHQYLSFDGMLRVVRSLGIHMNHDERKALQDAVTDLPRADHRKFEFFEFLLLMRWMLDRNFAQINSVLVEREEGEYLDEGRRPSKSGRLSVC